MEGAGLALEPVRRAARHGAARGDIRLGIEEDGEVREQAFGGPQGQIPDIINAEAAGDSLVCDRGVEVAVGQDHGTALQGGADPGGDVVRAVGRVQEGLGAGGDVVAVQEEAPDLDPQVRAPGLAGRLAFNARLLKQLGEDADLGGLTNAVAAFEGDEQARMRGTRCVGRVEDGPRLGGVVGHGVSVAWLSTGQRGAARGARRARAGDAGTRLRLPPPSPRSVVLRTDIGPVPHRDRSYSGSRSVVLRREIGPLPHRHRSASAPTSVRFRTEIGRIPPRDRSTSAPTSAVFRFGVVGVVVCGVAHGRVGFCGVGIGFCCDC